MILAFPFFSPPSIPFPLTCHGCFYEQNGQFLSGHPFFFFFCPVRCIPLTWDFPSSPCPSPNAGERGAFFCGIDFPSSHSPSVDNIRWPARYFFSSHHTLLVSSFCLPSLHVRILLFPFIIISCCVGLAPFWHYDPSDAPSFLL